VLSDLSKSLAAIAESPDAFYTGWIADRIAEDMAANGGLISKADLADYKAVERAPVRGTFLGHEIISMPPPSSGGVAMIEMLNILEELGIQKTKPGSVEAPTSSPRCAVRPRPRALPRRPGLRQYRSS
jgi:gamma-glutamyltranspeptidase/glutathione hydrolase